MGRPFRLVGRRRPSGDGYIRSLAERHRGRLGLRRTPYRDYSGLVEQVLAGALFVVTVLATCMGVYAAAKLLGH